MVVVDEEGSTLKEYYWMGEKGMVEQVGIAVDPKHGLDSIDFMPDEDFQRLRNDGLSLLI